MKHLAWLLVAVTSACPILADDFKFGFGAGATWPVWSLVTGDAPADYKVGWLVTGRALWIPKTSSLGVRLAGYYGQIPVTRDTALGVADSTLAGGGADLNLAIRMVGEGADGIYLNVGIGFRTLRQELENRYSEKLTLSDTNVSYNGGLGVSYGPVFGEVNIVYFKALNLEFLALPVTIGFQF